MSRARQHLHFYFLLLVIFLVCMAASATTAHANEASNRDDVPAAPRDVDTNVDDEALAPAFTPIPELTSGFQLLYTQQFPEAREKFTTWESEHPRGAFWRSSHRRQLPFRGVLPPGRLDQRFFPE